MIRCSSITAEVVTMRMLVAAHHGVMKSSAAMDHSNTPQWKSVGVGTKPQ